MQAPAAAASKSLKDSAASTPPSFSADRLMLARRERRRIDRIDRIDGIRDRLLYIVDFWASEVLKLFVEINEDAIVGCEEL